MTEFERRESWRKVDALFARVLERPADERLAYLRSLQDVDQELRRAVEALLDDHRSSEGFLESAPLLSPESLADVVAELGHAPSNDGAPAALPGERIGTWRVVGELGRGGMATVYLVERADGLFEQAAALKLLRRGLDTADLVARFETERRILSTLAHPGISMLLDGGATDEGRPYFVMERVEGEPITSWCDARSATVEARLRLFTEVARVVHHAHTRLVIHRDIKPSNILVTPDGRVKLLDFGIAKILDPDVAAEGDARTRSGLRALTPEYASPEQMRGALVTTATDVYQLGLLLHRLLTGARPRDVRGPSGRLATAFTPTPRRPSRVARDIGPAGAEERSVTPERLSRRLTGDLDAIVMKALESDPEQRYGAALAMAEDVERHLDGLPITARRAGAVYRVRKFLGRHRWVAPAAVAAILAIAVYVGTLIRHQDQVEGERNIARAEAVRAERIRDVLVGVFRGADPWSAENPRDVSEASLASALDIGTRRAREELADEPELRADVFASIADVYAGVDDLEAARLLLEEAVAIRGELVGQRSREVAVLALKLGSVYNRQARYDTAAALARRSLAVLRNRPGTLDSLVVRALAELGYAEKGLGRHMEAEDHLTAAAELLALQKDPPFELEALVARDLALLYARLDRPEEARAMARRQYEVTVERFGPNHLMTTRAKERLSETLFQTSHGSFDEAVRLQAEARRAYDSLLGPDHLRSKVAQIRLALMLRSADRLEEAERELRDAVAWHVELFGAEDWRSAEAFHWLAAVLYTAGKLEEADEAARRAEKIREAGGELTRMGLASTLVVRCGIQLHSGGFSAAESLCRRAIGILEAGGFENAAIMHGAKCRLAASLQARGESQEAVSLLDEVVEPLWKARTMQTPGEIRFCFESVASAYEALGRLDEATDLRRRAAGLSRRGLPGVRTE